MPSVAAWPRPSAPHPPCVPPCEMQAASKEWEVTCVSMGNPHAVVFVPDLDELDLPNVGPLFETHPAFPARINTEFVQVSF